MNKPLELGAIVHYVMPDLSCRAAIVTKIMGFAANLAVLMDSPEDMHAMPSPYRWPVHQFHPVVSQPGVSPAKKVPEYVPAAKFLEDKHFLSERTRFESEMENAHTDEEKKAVRPMAKYSPPSPEDLAHAEEMRQLGYDEIVKNTFVNTYHLAAEHDAMIDLQHDREIAKANRELDKVKAKHSATIKHLQHSDATEPSRS